MSTELEPLEASLDGETLIEASAGTGKTHTITTLFVRLVLERGLDVRQILVVTYTTAATAELRTRVRARLLAALRAVEAYRRDIPVPAEQDAQMWQLAARRVAQRDADRERLLLALHGFDQAAIFTIHGFCERVLHDFAFESGADFDAELTTDQTALLDEVIADFWVRALSPASLPVVAALRGERRRLIELAKKVVAQRDLTVVPENPTGEADLGTAEAAWRAAHAAAAAQWIRDGEAAMERLCDPAAGLHAGTYKAAKIRAEWVPALARLFADQVAVGLGEARSAAERCGTTWLAKGVKKKRAPPSHAFFDACEQMVVADRSLQAAVAERVVGLQIELARYASSELARRKRAAGVRYFDDLLHGLADALNAPGPGAAALAEALRQRFPAALIDEFQDTDPLQYDIVRRIYHGAEGARLFLIGDPKQAIYGFRGADVFAYLAAKRDSGAQRYTLRHSWRSDPHFLDAINALFGVADPFVIDGIDYEPQHPAPTMRDRLGGGWPALQILFGRRPPSGKRSKPEATALALSVGGNEIVRLLERGAIEGRAIRERDVAVLCRTNRQAKEMQAALRRRGVAGVLHGDSSVFETAEADELQRVLDALARPGDVAALRSALATS
ncbi:MAG: UvrD-helicase domain-containing protein, partial [Candidatus Binatia bacterium]